MNSQIKTTEEALRPVGWFLMQTSKTGRTAHICRLSRERMSFYRICPVPTLLIIILTES